MTFDDLSDQDYSDMGWARPTPQQQIEAAGLSLDDFTDEEKSRYGLTLDEPYDINAEIEKPEPKRSDGYSRDAIPSSTEEGIEFAFRDMGADIKQAANVVGGAVVGLASSLPNMLAIAYESLGGPQESDRHSTSARARAHYGARKRAGLNDKRTDEQRAQDFQNNPLQKFSEFINAWWAVRSGYDPTHPTANKWPEKLLSGLTSTVFLGGMGKAGELVKMPRMIATFFTSLAAEGQQIHADVLKETGSMEKAWEAYIRHGAVAGAAESIGFEGLMGNMPKILSGMPKWMQDYVMAPLGEGAGEAVTAYDENAAYNWALENPEARDEWLNVLESGLLGVGVGGMFKMGQVMLKARDAQVQELQPVESPQSDDPQVQAAIEDTSDREYPEPEVSEITETEDGQFTATIQTGEDAEVNITADTLEGVQGEIERQVGEQPAPIDEGDAIVEERGEGVDEPALAEAEVEETPYEKSKRKRKEEAARIESSRRVEDSSDGFSSTSVLDPTYGAEARTYLIEDKNGGFAKVLVKPDGERPSVLNLFVPEEHRGKGYGRALSDEMSKRFPGLQGQVQSKAAAKIAFDNGRRPLDESGEIDLNASFEDVLALMERDSSVNLITPTAPTPVAEEPVTAEDEPKAKPVADDGKHYAINNEQMERVTDELDLEPVEQLEAESFEGWNEEAGRRLQQNPRAGEELINELTESNRETTPVETLILAREETDLETRLEELEKEIIESVGDAQVVSAKQAEVERILAKISVAAQAYKNTGTLLGRALAARRARLRKDYSLAALTRKLSVAKDGEAVTAEEYETLKDLSSRVAKAESKVTELTEQMRKASADVQAKTVIDRARKEQKKKTGRKKPKAPATPKAKLDYFHRKAEKARASLAERSTHMRSGLSTQDIADMGWIAADYIATGVAKGKALLDKMVAEFGESIRPHIDEITRKADEYANQSDSAVTLDEAIDAVNREKPTPVQIQDLALAIIVEDKITELDALTDEIERILGDTSLTRERIRELLSGYGVLRKLSKAEGRETLRELKGEALQLSKIADLEKKLPPKKTGFPTRELNDKERKLLKEVNRLKKELGIETTDPETQLKSSRETRRTRLENRLADLRRQIETKQRDPKSSREPATDEHIESLLVEIKAAEEIFKETFKPETDAEQVARSLKLSEESIQRIQDKIDSGDLSVEPRKTRPTSPELEASRAKQKQLQKELNALRNPKKTEDQKRKEQLERSLRSARATTERLTEKLTVGDTSKAQRKESVTSPELDAIREINKEIRKELNALRNPPKSALQKRKDSVQRTIDELERMLRENDFEGKKRRVVDPDSELIRLEAEAHAVRELVNEMREAERYKRRTTEEKLVDATKEIFNLPRAVMTAWDASAPFRQGIVLSLSHPIKTGQMMPKMLKALTDEAYAKRVQLAIRNRPGASFAEMSGAELTSLDGKLGPQEEAIHSKLSDMVPGVKRSGHAFTVFLNLQRATIFDMMVDSLPPGTVTLERGKDIAYYVNIATGRGQPSGFAGGLKKLTGWMWSPSLQLSRIQMMKQAIDVAAGRGDKHVNKIIAKSMARSAFSLSAVYALASMFGADIEDDPRSSDFGKIRFGKTRIDPLGGFAQYWTLGARLLSGKTRQSTTGRIIPLAGDYAGQTTKLDVATRFLGYKATPILGLTGTILDDMKDFKGDKMTVTDLAKNYLLPISFNDTYEVIQEHGVAAGSALAMTSMLGAGIQTYDYAEDGAGEFYDKIDENRGSEDAKDADSLIGRLRFDDDEEYPRWLTKKKKGGDFAYVVGGVQYKDSAAYGASIPIPDEETARKYRIKFMKQYLRSQ